MIGSYYNERGLKLEILGVPTQRAADGLALSSRNAYLSEPERRIAPTLHRTIASVAEAVAGGHTAAQGAISSAVGQLGAAGFMVDYVAVCDAETLESVETAKGPTRVLAAARLGRTRLIDNVPVVTPEP